MRWSDDRMSERRGLLMVANKCLTSRDKNDSRRNRECGSTNLDQTASNTAERRSPPGVPGRDGAKARGDSLLPARQGRRGWVRLQTFRITSDRIDVMFLA